MNNADKKLQAIAAIKATHLNNIGVQCFDADYFRSLSIDLQNRLLFCINSGIENPESDMGCYAGQPDDYDDLSPFFSQVISRHHGVSESARHACGWSTGFEDGSDRTPSELDLKKLGLAPCSMRIRVGRNFDDLPLTSAMNMVQRFKLEERMTTVFAAMQASSAYAGTYHSLTPGHANTITDEQRQDLINDHLLFKPMDKDPFLAAAGIANDWPHGRGCYVSFDQSFVVWVGEEDHLRIMTMQTGHRPAKLLSDLKSFIQAIVLYFSSDFALSDRFGFITTCPTNIGTGMRASVHLRLPALTAGGSEEKVKKIASPLGLSVRGLGGEHTPIGYDGTVDISPRARFCISEEEIISRLFAGIAALQKAEAQCKAGQSTQL